MSASATPFRFDPPAVALTPGLRWILARAFGPAELAVDEVEGLSAVALANSLGLAPRIAARHAQDRLAGELGAAAAAELRRFRALAAAQEMRLMEALSTFDSVAADLRVPYAPLKGQALMLGGYAPERGRASADVDLLVPEARLATLQSELRQRGFTEVGEAYEHQAPLLKHRDGGALELHRVILGVRIGGTQSASFEALVAANLLGVGPVTWRTATEKPRGDLRLPRRELLTAHALVHVLSQHGLTPRAYPGLVLIGDLLDLAFRGSAGRATLATIAPWIERAVTFEEASAALDLTTTLAAWGAALQADDGARRSPPRLLLDHFLAGATNPRYGESLKVRALEQPLSDRSTTGARVALVTHALLPARTKNAEGEKERLPGYLARLAGRPFDLFRRWRSARAAGRGEE